MTGSFFLALREGLEASIVVGVILTQLYKNKQRNLVKYVYMGILLGAALCIIGGTVLSVTLGEFKNNDIVEGIMMLVSAAFIAYLPYWIHRNSSASALEARLSNNAEGLSLFALAFLTVSREGMELFVFIVSQFKESSYPIALGASVGLFLAILITYLLFKTSLKLNLSVIFNILNLSLILFGGRLLSKGLVKLFDISLGLQWTVMLIFWLGALYLLYQKNLGKLLQKQKS